MINNSKAAYSRFIRRTLLPQEFVVRDAQFPIYYTALCFMYFGMFFLGGIVVHKLIFKFTGFITMVPVHIGFFSGLWMFFWMMMRKWTTEIILTNMRLIYKWGIVSIVAREVDIEQLASHDVQQSLLGRFLNYGIVHIRCIEASDIFLPPIDRPYEFRNALEKQKQAYREKYLKVEHLRRKGPENEEQLAANQKMADLAPPAPA